MPNPTYVEYGPFTNGTPPGINQNFLDALETFLLAINTLATDPSISASGGIATLLALVLNPTAVSVTGSVSGTATLYQYIQGTIKKAIVFWNNYKSAASQTLALPIAFTQGAAVQTWETQGQTLEFLSSGTAQTMSVINTIASSGGSQSPLTVLKSYSSAQVRSGFDTIRLTFTTTAAGGFAIIEGI